MLLLVCGRPRSLRIPRLVGTPSKCSWGRRRRRWERDYRAPRSPPPTPGRPPTPRRGARCRDPNTAKSRKNYAGTSPITRASGTKKVVLARFARNGRLADAIYRWAFAALTASTGARAFYDAHRDAGDTHHAALRALGNRLVGILHGCLQHHMLYDENLAWGSPPPPRPRHVTARGPVPSPNETNNQPVTSPNETTRPGLCAGPGCANPIPPRPTGRPARFCSTACRARSHRVHRPATEPITVEIDRGSASSQGRPPQRQWLIRLRRGDPSIIIAIGLPRTGAEHLAEQIDELLHPTLDKLKPWDV